MRYKNVEVVTDSVTIILYLLTRHLLLGFAILFCLIFFFYID